MTSSQESKAAMKLTVVHDAEGVIVALLARPANAPLARVPAAADHTRLELEMPELDSGLHPRELARLLADVRDNHRVAGGRLVRTRPMSTAPSRV